jgi:hypothetical protein
MSHIRLVSFGILLLGATVTPQPLDAQKPYRVTRTPGELISAFAREYQTPSGPTSGAGLDIAHVLTYPDQYPAADLESFLAGLEQVALTGDSSRLRASAAFSLSLPGSRRKPHPVPATMARLERIYYASKDPAVRGVVVTAMADQAERQEALRFLERLAVQEKPDFPAAASRALATLVAMDAEGRVVLKRLHESGAVREPEARHQLTLLASRGYRIK